VGVRASAPPQVCVVALCAAQRDLVHACYLALALLLFRKRTDIRRNAAAAAAAAAEQQREREEQEKQQAEQQQQQQQLGQLVRQQPASGSAGGIGAWRTAPSVASAAAPSVASPFWLLPAFNLAVMFMELVYQVGKWAWLPCELNVAGCGWSAHAMMEHARQVGEVVCALGGWVEPQQRMLPPHARMAATTIHAGALAVYLWPALGQRLPPAQRGRPPLPPHARHVHAARAPGLLQAAQLQQLKFQ